MAEKPPDLTLSAPTKGLLDLARLGMKAVPAVKYAVGVGGVLAVFALIRPFFKSPGSAVVAGLLMFILMWVLFIFAAATKQAQPTFRLPILVCTWATLLLFLTCSCMTASSVFFRWPMSFHELIQQVSGGSSIQTTSGSQLSAPLDPQQARQAVKVHVEPVTHDLKVGDPLDVRVFLLDSTNAPSEVKDDVAITVELKNRFGIPEKKIAILRPNQASAAVQFETKEPGLLELKAYRTDAPLLNGSSTVLVLPRSPSGALRPDAPQPSRFPNQVSVSRLQPQYQYARTGLRSMGNTASTVTRTSLSPSGPRVGLIVTISDRGSSGFLADGRDPAVVSVFFVDSAGAPAPTDIHVWFTWTQGKFEPQPLTIRKGEVVASGQLTSMVSGTAGIRFVASAPKYEVRGPTQFSISFFQPIYGVSLTAPRTVPFFGHGIITLQFLNREGQPVATNVRRLVSLGSNDRSVELIPSSITIPPGAYSASVVVVPKKVTGKVEVRAQTPGYAIASVTFEVGGATKLILFWGVGSIWGGLLALGARRARAWTLFIGLIGSAVLIWSFVFIVLPQSESPIFHNVFSIFSISGVGSYLAVRAMDSVMRVLQ